MKYFKTNLNLTITIVMVGILSISLLIINKSYALFENTINTETILSIETIDSFKTEGPLLIDTIKEKAYTDEGELIAINNTGSKCESLENCEVREYRYSGTNVNNYLYLKNNNNENELWRIIGIFKDPDKNQEEYIRVVRDEVLPRDYFPKTFTVSKANYQIWATSVYNYAFWNRLNGDVSDHNNWSEAGLQYFLNKASDGENPGYLNYLSDKTKLVIDSRKVYLGATIPGASGDNTKDAYLHERDITNCPNDIGNSSDAKTSGCRVFTGNAAFWFGEVSLMYPSDYGYSTAESYWDEAMYDYQKEAKDTSWLLNAKETANKNFWLVSPSSYYSYTYVNYVAQEGFVGYYNIYNNYLAVRPVLNLKSNIEELSGFGTLEKPYKLIFKSY